MDFDERKKKKIASSRSWGFYNGFVLYSWETVRKN